MSVASRVASIHEAYLLDDLAHIDTTDLYSAAHRSPFTGRLCEALAQVLNRSTEIGQRVLNWPGRPDARGDSVPLH